MVDAACCRSQMECTRPANKTEYFEEFEFVDAKNMNFPCTIFDDLFNSEDEQCMDEDMTFIPQAYWDDLFESAYTSLDVIPF